MSPWGVFSANKNGVLFRRRQRPGREHRSLRHADDIYHRASGIGTVSWARTSPRRPVRRLSPGVGVGRRNADGRTRALKCREPDRSRTPVTLTAGHFFLIETVLFWTVCLICHCATDLLAVRWLSFAHCGSLPRNQGKRPCDKRGHRILVRGVRIRIRSASTGSAKTDVQGGDIGSGVRTELVDGA